MNMFTVGAHSAEGPADSTATAVPAPQQALRSPPVDAAPAGQGPAAREGQPGVGPYRAARIVAALKPPRRSRRGGHPSRFLKAFARWGTISAAARTAGVSYRTARQWIDTDPAFRVRLEQARAQFQDSIRQRMLARADQGNDVMLKFFAKGELLEHYARASSEARKKEARTVADQYWEDWWAKHEATVPRFRTARDNPPHVQGPPLEDGWRGGQG